MTKRSMIEVGLFKRANSGESDLLDCCKFKLLVKKRESSDATGHKQEFGTKGTSLL